MTLAIMQPYLLPYIGYFQLIKSVEKFVIYDDVNYIKQGWINRNRILLNGQDFKFTLQVEGASSFIKINEVKTGQNTSKLLKTFYQAYNQAPYFSNVYPLLEEIFFNDERDLAKFIFFSIKKISSYLGINTQFLISSTIDKNNNLKGQQKVIDICKNLDSTTYINTIGGQELYSKDVFLEENIELKFIKSNPIVYKQFDNIFIQNLSIVDVLMFNSCEITRKMLTQYELI